MNYMNGHTDLHAAIDRARVQLGKAFEDHAEIGCGNPDRESEVLRSISAHARMLAFAADELQRSLQVKKLWDEAGLGIAKEFPR